MDRFLRKTIYLLTNGGLWPPSLHQTNKNAVSGTTPIAIFEHEAHHPTLLAGPLQRGIGTKQNTFW